MENPGETLVNGEHDVGDGGGDGGDGKDMVEGDGCSDNMIQEFGQEYTIWVTKGIGYG